MCDCRLPRDLLKEYFAAVTELSYRSAAMSVLWSLNWTEEGFKTFLCLRYGEIFLCSTVPHFHEVEDFI